MKATNQVQQNGNGTVDMDAPVESGATIDFGVLTEQRKEMQAGLNSLIAELDQLEKIRQEKSEAKLRTEGALVMLSRILDAGEVPAGQGG